MSPALSPSDCAVPSTDAGSSVPGCAPGHRCTSEASSPCGAASALDTSSTTGRPLDAGVVFREHRTHVRAALRRLGVPWDRIDDAQQEVFLRVHLGLSRYDPSRDLKGWLVGICRHVAQDDLTSRRRHHPAPPANETAPPANDTEETPGGDPCKKPLQPVDPIDPRDAAEARELLARIPRALGRLKASEREIIDLLHDGVEPSEIGLRLGLTPAAARQRVVRARQALDREILPTDNRLRVALAVVLTVLALASVGSSLRLLSDPLVVELLPWLHHLAPDREPQATPPRAPPRGPRLCATTCPDEEPPPPPSPSHEAPTPAPHAPAP